jgi:hypothetical protein
MPHALLEIERGEWTADMTVPSVLHVSRSFVKKADSRPEQAIHLKEKRPQSGGLFSAMLLGHSFHCKCAEGGVLIPYLAVRFVFCGLTPRLDLVHAFPLLNNNALLRRRALDLHRVLSRR